MTFALGRRLLSSSLPAVRVARTNVGAATRRRMASSAHGPAPKSDTPWLLASGAVTVAGSAYLLTPPSKQKAHKVAETHVKKEVTAPLPAQETPKEPEPEPAPAPASEPASEPAPEPQAEEKPESAEKPDEPASEEPATVKDDEGTEVPAEDVKASVEKSVEADSPKDAKAAEETSKPESKPESS